MKNTVIANRKKGDWEIIKKYFEERGVDVHGTGSSFVESGSKWGHYGVVDGEFVLISLQQAQQANATILEVSDIDKEFKVGDVVVVTQKHFETGKVTEITCGYKGDDRYFNLKDCEHPYKPSQMRHATPEERAIYYAQNEIDKALKNVSDTVTLPRSFVLEAHKEACCDWKKRIEEVVPELFVKNELIVGKWYKSERSLFNYQKGYKVYGFMDGIWQVCDWEWPNPSDTPIEPATESEVFEALKNEAVKRGFKEGVKCIDAIDGQNEVLRNTNFALMDSSMTLYAPPCRIFHAGKWASIISDPIPQELESLISKLGKDKILEYLKD